MDDDIKFFVVKKYLDEIIDFNNNSEVLVELDDGRYVLLVPYLAEDLNKDTHVNFDDLLEFLSAYGTTGEPGWIRADINKDGVVDFDDLLLFLPKYNMI